MAYNLSDCSLMDKRGLMYQVFYIRDIRERKSSVFFHSLDHEYEQALHT